MAKEVTVLALEGSFMRGVQLTESGGSFARQKSEVWALADLANDAAPDGAAAAQEDASPQEPVSTAPAASGKAPSSSAAESSRQNRRFKFCFINKISFRK